MGRMCKSLEWELDWIDANPQYYDSPEHISAVKANITKRYLANEVKRLLHEQANVCK